MSAPYGFVVVGLAAIRQSASFSGPGANFCANIQINPIFGES